VDSASNVTIGGVTEEEENIIGYNPSSIEVKDHSSNYLIKRNSLFCSDWGVYFSNLPDTPEAPGSISVTDAFTITGTAPDGADVWIYKSDTGCTSCEGKDYIGLASSEGGIWELNMDTPVELGDVITAMASLDGNSSVFAECMTVDLIPVAAEEVNVSDEWSFYPNPASTELYITLSAELADRSQLKIINSTGVTVLVSDRLSTENHFTIDHLTTGIYLIFVSDNEMVRTGVLLLED